jgi:energy-coupling factor transport system substrate-specific component
MVLYILVNILILIICGIIARTFGKKEGAGGGWNFKYTTRDIVILAVIAAIAGVVNTGMGNVWYLANSSLGPMGGALLQGAFMWAYILAVWLIRKPGVALALGIIEAAVEILLGNASGVGTLGWGIFQGLGIEVVMAFTRYNKYDLVAALCAGAAASQFGTVWTAILFGWDPSYARDVWMAIPINLISGIILSGLIGYLLAKAIARTGLVRSTG